MISMCEEKFNRTDRVNMSLEHMLPHGGVCALRTLVGFGFVLDTGGASAARFGGVGLCGPELWNQRQYLLSTII